MLVLQEYRSMLNNLPLLLAKAYKNQLLQPFFSGDEQVQAILQEADIIGGKTRQDIQLSKDLAYVICEHAWRLNNVLREQQMTQNDLGIIMDFQDTQSITFEGPTLQQETVRQAFMELLKNAIRHTGKEGKITIRATTVRDVDVYQVCSSGTVDLATILNKFRVLLQENPNFGQVFDPNIVEAALDEVSVNGLSVHDILEMAKLSNISTREGGGTGLFLIDQSVKVLGGMFALGMAPDSAGLLATMVIPHNPQQGAITVQRIQDEYQARLKVG